MSMILFIIENITKIVVIVITATANFGLMMRFFASYDATQGAWAAGV